MRLFGTSLVYSNDPNAGNQNHRHDCQVISLKSGESITVPVDHPRKRTPRRTRAANHGTGTADCIAIPQTQHKNEDAHCATQRTLADSIRASRHIEGSRSEKTDREHLGNPVRNTK